MWPPATSPYTAPPDWRAAQPGGHPGGDDADILVVIGGTFLLAGFVKGVIWLGLPGVMFLQAIGLPRDMLVQAMGMLFTPSTLALALALGTSGLLSAQLSGLSLAAVLPALAGMVAGQALRHRLSEAAFRRVFFLSLVALGIYIIAGA